jgi:PHD/YefM family antitoxin component YafN of YafNO toxin-antitoxin module
VINLDIQYKNVATLRKELKAVMMTGGPVIITLNGKPHSVLLRIETWEDFMDYITRKRKRKTAPTGAKETL